MWGCTLTSGLVVTEGQVDFNALGGPKCLVNAFLQNALATVGFRAQGESLAKGVTAFVDWVTVDLDVGHQACTAVRRWRTGHLSLTANREDQPDEVLAVYTEDDAWRYEYRVTLAPGGAAWLDAVRLDDRGEPQDSRRVLLRKGGPASGYPRP